VLAVLQHDLVSGKGNGIAEQESLQAISALSSSYKKKSPHFQENEKSHSSIPGSKPIPHRTFQNIYSTEQLRIQKVEYSEHP